MQIEPTFRASDADREEAADRLRHATVEGRLDADELEERLHALFAARTYGELDALLADLPAGRSRGRQRVGVARSAAAVGAFALMLVAAGTLMIARLHAAAAVVGAHPAGGRTPRIPGPPLGFRPPLADPMHGPLVAASMFGVFLVLVVCAIVLWVLMRSGARVGAGPSSRSE